MTIACFTALLAVSSPLCKRCGHNVDPDIKTAANQASKALKVKPEPASVVALINREHGWGKPSRTAQNPRSSAYGYGQFINATWKTVGIKKTSCGWEQIKGIIIYCRKRHGSVAAAVRAWDSRAKTSRGGRPRGGWY